MALSQFFVLSPRGDTIILKDFRGDCDPMSHEIFFRKVKFWEKGEAPPVFRVDGVSYLFIKRNSLLLAVTTRFNVSPAATIELLNRVAKVFKDYCGVLSEESIRKNFILIYELLDEMIDFGYPQITSTEMLKNCIHNEPVAVAQAGVLSSSSMLMNMNMNMSKTKSSASSNVPIAMSATGRGGKNKNEIYVDIVERINVLFNSSGLIVNSSIDGSILMKSFLSGNPELRLALNEDLVIGKGGSYGSVVLDDCNFHECVHLDEFETARTLHFVPPDGEFAVLNYRVTADFKPPFRIFPHIEEVPGGYKLEIVCMIRCEVPEGGHATNVVVKIPVPRATVSGTVELSSECPGVTAEYVNGEKKVVMVVRKFAGASEITLKAKVTLDSVITHAQKRELGPVSMAFEIPMHNSSNLQVRYLRISEMHKSYNPYRWVRYITQSSSYVYRLNA